MAIYRSWEMASFLKHQETASAGFKLFFPAASSLLLTFREWRRVRTLLWSRLWLERLLWLVWSSVQTTQIFSVTTARLFGFLIIQVFTGVALLIFLKNFSLHSQLGCLMQALLKPISVLDMPSSGSLIMFLFWFKLRDV